MFWMTVLCWFALGSAQPGAAGGPASQPPPAQQTAAAAAAEPSADQAHAPSPASGEAVDPRDLLAPLPAAADALARGRQELGREAQAFETEHFVLVYVSAEDAARRLAPRLEAVYRANVRFLGDLGLTARRPPHKLEALVFDTYQGFRAYQRSLGSLNDEVLGFYDPSADRTVFFDLETYPPIVQLRTNLQRYPWVGSKHRRRLRSRLRRNTAALLAKVVQHEAAHQIHTNVGLLPARAEAPPWLVEGLAQMYELPFVERSATLELSTNRYRLFEFTQLHRDDSALLADLRRIIAADNQQQPAGKDYPLSWALTNYLHKRHRTRLAAYLRHIGAPQETAADGSLPRLQEFERFFGPVDQHFATQFGAYMRRLEQRCGVAEHAAPVFRGEQSAISGQRSGP